MMLSVYVVYKLKSKVINVVICKVKKIKRKIKDKLYLIED